MQLMVVLTDRTGSVPATFWDKAALEANKILEEGRAYAFTGGDISLAERYGTTGRPYWIDFRSPGTPPRPLWDEEFGIPRIEDLVIDSFARLAHIAYLTRVAVQGRITCVSTLAGNPPRRKITMTDNSEEIIFVTFWDDQVDLINDSMIGQTVRLHELSLGNSATFSSSKLTVLRQAQ
jgi:hypothetical protein